MIRPLSEKATDSLLNSHNRHNFLIGAVRAGKSFVAALRWIKFLHDEVDKDDVVLLAGPNIKSLEKHTIKLLRELVGPENLSYSRSKQELLVNGKKHYVVEAKEEVGDDELYPADKASMKIAAISFKGAFVEDLVHVPRNFMQVLTVRLCCPGAKAFYTLNPSEDPKHWIKTDWIDRQNEINEACENGIGIWWFNLDDNNTLNSDYVKVIKASTKSEWTSNKYRTLIEGKWGV